GGRHAPGNAGTGPQEVLDQPEVGHLDAPAQDQQVLRLDVEVLEPVDLVHEVQRLGGVAQVAEQFAARHAGQPGIAARLVALLEAEVGQLSDDQEPAVDHLVTLERQEEGVADRLDPVQRAALLLGARAGHVAEDDLQRLEDPAWGLTLPDLAVATRTEPIKKVIARDRLATW